MDQLTQIKTLTETAITAADTAVRSTCWHQIPPAAVAHLRGGSHG